MHARKARTDGRVRAGSSGERGGNLDYQSTACSVSAARPWGAATPRIRESAAPEAEVDAAGHGGRPRGPGMTLSPNTVSRLAGWLVVALALAFLGHELWRSSPWALAGARASELALAVGMGALVYGVAGFLLADAWRHLLGPGPAEADPWRHRALYGRTQIAKYLPGNCLHFVGRQVLGRRLGHSHGTLALASAAEVASLLVVAGALALPAAWPHIEQALGVPVVWLVPAAAGVIGVLVCLNARRVSEWRVRAAHCACGPIGAWTPRVLQAGLLHAAFFLVAGLVLWAVATAVCGGSAPALGPTTAISTMAMAWWVGYVTPGASAGVGVREAALVLALGPELGSDGAMLTALALRLITLCGDLLFFALSVVTPRNVPASRDPANADARPISPILE
jgi:hypothetical protein